MGKRAPQVTGKDSDVSFGEVVEGRVRGRTSRDQITYSERGNIQGAQFSRWLPRPTKRRGARGSDATCPPTGFCRTYAIEIEEELMKKHHKVDCRSGRLDAPRLQRRRAGRSSATAVLTAWRKSSRRRERGTLTMYTTFAEKDQPTLVRPFEAKYGIKVNIWRAGTDKVLQRTLVEAAARKYDVDLVHFGCARDGGAFAREDPAGGEFSGAQGFAARLGAGATANGLLRCSRCGCRLTTPISSGNRICPRTYADLLDPKWKGKLGIEAKNQDWFASVVDVMGEARRGSSSSATSSRGTASLRAPDIRCSPTW